jgi:uncharacterized protein HemX
MSDKEDQKEETNVIESTNDKDVSSDDKKKSNIKYIVITTIILIVIIAVSFVLVNNRLNSIVNDIEQSKVGSNSIEQDISNQLNDIQSRFTGIQTKLEELQSKQDVLSHSLSQPVEQQININKDYALAEIEHLLVIANHNLHIEHNVATALSAMETADARLSGMTDPNVLSVREQLVADMNELRSLNQADLSGMALYLSDLINRVDELVVKENAILEKQEVEKEKQEVPVEGIKHFFSLVFNELKSLIIITRDKDVGKARLLPDEIYFLKANLKLELANARFAVFNRDTDNLRSSIAHVHNWLQNYFDLSDANVRNIYDSLSKMKKIELKFPELDISSSLESVRALSRIEDASYQNESNNEHSEELDTQ